MCIKIIGCGLVTSLGNSVDENWQAALAGKSVMREITRFPADDFPQPKGGILDDETEAELISSVEEENLAYAMIIKAADEAIAGRQLPEGCGLVMASNFGLMENREWAWRERIETGEMDGETFEFQQNITRHVAGRIGLSGPTAHLSLSCASGAAAVSLGRQWLITGRCSDVLVICYDELTEFIWCGLSNLRTITTETLRPFNIERSGTIFSEGAGAMLLTTGDATETQAFLAGSATNNNAYHMTAPCKEAEGSRQVMVEALRQSGLSADKIDVVCAHATGTAANDVTEAAAINNLLDNRKVPVLALKSNLGHMMGAAGMAEAILTIQALKNGVLPNIANTVEKDPQCDVDAVLGGKREGSYETAITNSAGLGGNNSSLVLTTSECRAQGAECRGVKLVNAGWVLPGNVGSGRELPKVEPKALIPHNSTLEGFPVKEYISSVKGYLDPVGAFSLAAASLCLGDNRPADLRRTAIISATQYGAALSGYRFMEMLVNKGHRFASPMIFPHSYANTAGNLVAIEFGFSGEHFVFDNATDAAEAGEIAVSLIQTGAADDALVIVNEGAPADSLPDGTELLHGAICLHYGVAEEDAELPAIVASADNRRGTVFSILTG